MLLRPDKKEAEEVLECSEHRWIDIYYLGEGIGVESKHKQALLFHKHDMYCYNLAKGP